MTEDQTLHGMSPLDLQHNMDATYTCNSQRVMQKQDNNKLNSAIFVTPVISLKGSLTWIGAGQYHKLIHQATKCMRHRMNVPD